MFSGLLIILLPLIAGYLIPLHRPSALKLIARLLSWIVYVILFFMGISLAFLDNLASNLLSILHYAAVSVVIILLCNIAALMWLEQKMPWQNHHRQEKLPSRLAMALESLQLCGVVLIGFLIGLSGLPFLQHATEASEYTLIFLLFLIGIQLRNNGMTLRQIVLNRRGMMVAVVVMVSSLLGGIINAFILDLPLKTGLAMASGFGWYSLSGILLTESYGPVIGSAAFFNDLARAAGDYADPGAGTPQPFNGARPVRRNIDGFYAAGAAALRRRGDRAGSYCSWLHSQPAGAHPDGLFLRLIPLRR